MHSILQTIHAYLALFISWISNTFQKITLSILVLGPVPKHVAFVMDGNRRFAKRLHLQPSEGHQLGFKKLEETLDWCMKLGIKVVTVYAFSIENFKRPKEEVDVLMELAERKFGEFVTKSDLVQKHGISIRVIGDTKLLREPVYKAACKVTSETCNNTGAILNICCPYTSQNEILVAMQEVVQGVQSGKVLESDVCEKMIEQCLYTEECPPLDVLVRTSGEARLSDFMLWQAGRDCLLHFPKKLWPEFSFWDMLPILLHYQANYAKIKVSRFIPITQLLAVFDMIHAVVTFIPII
ncbi:hypothetical protein BATDEDRAFT_10818 [Batrachochytrium dendrobatidis JAM81]|uniref:Alkyl transferase n=1 Tax=Batrachochytrium dendrobatidis (strain JAM81 / FGSC 10211) TaxID=684364 RepID=F4NZT9_BATDJ|nr:uncharacterized protein BATDEDRAFT_10818 [Batrachochytrium dendrobatidis JAM81]EGF81244.1 hypothetical protein BATDEDRAFT_10818 [Batrachochytrium dendrobatidis JAM81]|eukprot:XP_006677764.1 hypothetical protein BATDEDRAFT_10818 [Batrachochytrium dendrobatidis JAM81]